MKQHRLIILAFAAACFAALGSAPVSASNETILATHDGASYTLEDFNIFFMQQLGARGLVSFLEQAIVYEEAKKLKLTPTAEEKQKFIEEEMSREIYAGFAELYSQPALDRFVEYMIMNRKYRQHLEQVFLQQNKVQVTDEDAHRYYNQNIGLFHPGERAWISVISVETLETANEVLTKLNAGENFNELAGVYNVDPELRARLGYVGMMERGKELPQPIEDAAFSLQPGQYSQVIKGTLFHIIYVHNRKPEEKHDFAEVKEDIKQLIKEDIVQKYIDEYLNDLYSRELQKFEIKANLFRAGEES